MFDRLKSLFSRTPSPKMQHPVLGELQFEGCFWQGAADCGGMRLEVAIAGTKLGPDANALAATLGRLEQIDKLKDEVVSFLTSSLKDVPEVDASELTMTSVEFLWRGDPGRFMVRLALKGDEYGLWRIEFVHGQPKFLGRDD
jgi:hypothetical protein